MEELKLQNLNFKLFDRRTAVSVYKHRSCDHAFLVQSQRNVLIGCNLLLHLDGAINDFSSDRSEPAVITTNMSTRNKSKARIHISKPEPPPFLQRMKEQIVANEDAERRQQSERKRKNGPRKSDDLDDGPTIVRIGDEDLTEEEYKRLKLGKYLSLVYIL